MTTQEFKEEFKLQYDLQSKGGAGVDDYELSVFLNLAMKDVLGIIIDSYESNEKSRRLVNSLLKKKATTNPLKTFSDANLFMKYNIDLPYNAYAILKEDVELLNCVTVPDIVNSKLDEVNTFMVNPFKKPNKRKVLRVEDTAGVVTFYSTAQIKKHVFYYIENPEPIIVSDLDYGLTIDGKSKKNNTNIHEMIHPKIVQLAVAKALATIRGERQKTN